MPFGFLQWCILTFNQHERLQSWCGVYVYTTAQYRYRPLLAVITFTYDP